MVQVSVEFGLSNIERMRVNNYAMAMQCDVIRMFLLKFSIMYPLIRICSTNPFRLYRTPSVCLFYSNVFSLFILCECLIDHIKKCIERKNVSSVCNSIYIYMITT